MGLPSNSGKPVGAEQHLPCSKRVAGWYKVGNSLGAILPAEVAARLDVKEGDSLFVTETPDGIPLSPYDPDFDKAMEAFGRGGRRHRNALRRLAK